MGALFLTLGALDRHTPETKRAVTLPLLCEWLVIEKYIIKTIRYNLKPFYFE